MRRFFYILGCLLSSALAQEKGVDLVIGSTTYPNAILVKVLPDRLLILYDYDVAKIPFEEIPEELRIKYALTQERADAYRQEKENVRKAREKSEADARVPSPATPSSPGDRPYEVQEYRNKALQAIHARWKLKVRLYKEIPKSTVTARFIVNSDGYPDNIQFVKRTGKSEVLESIIRKAIEEAGPFGRFTESMRRNAGENYTEEMTFSIYLEKGMIM